MLKQPLHSMRRRALGRATAFALLLATGYAAWAAQPAQPSSSTVPAGKIAADIALRVDEGAPVQLRAFADAGVPFSVSSDEAGKQYAIEGTVTRMQHAGQPSLALDLRIVEGSGLVAGPKLVREVASPKIVLRNGKAGSIQMGQETRAADGSTAFKGLRLDILLTDSMPVAVAVPKPMPAPASTPSAKPKPISAKQAMAAKPIEFNTYERMLTSFSASWQPPKPTEEGC